MKFNSTFLSRALIALLFVVAGLGKAAMFNDPINSPVTMIGGLGVPFPWLATVIVIFIEVVVALAFAFGYKTRTTGWILIAFTALATVLVHRNIGDQMQMTMALKNIAIIGGLLAAIKCTCGSCLVHGKK